MPHPSNLIPKNPHYISGNVTATLTSGYFHSVTALTGIALTVKGGGIFEYVVIDNATDTDVVKYINPDTGEPFPGVVDGSAGDLADGKAAGFYEKIGTEAVTITGVPAGLTVHGRFTEINSADNEIAIAYK